MSHALEPRCFHLRADLPGGDPAAVLTVCDRRVDYQRAVGHPDNVCCPDCVAKIHEVCGATHCKAGLSDCTKEPAMNTVRAEMIGKHDKTPGCMCESCGSLSFSEAMALAKTEPVVMGHGGCRAMKLGDNGVLYFAGTAEVVPFQPEWMNEPWRRVRLRRWRLDEMADGIVWQAPTFRAIGEEVIRAVCRYLHDDSKNRASHHRDVVADDVEREFLVPR